MHIALFLGSLQVGGAERQFAVLARGLAKRGHRVSFVTMLGGGALESELNEVPGVELHSFRQSGSGARLLWTARRALPAWFEEHNPDVLYSALYHANWLAASRSRAARIPVVWGIRTATEQLSRQQSFFMSLGRRHRQSVSAAISNSSRGMDLHRDWGYLPAAQHVIPNGVDTERFRPDAGARAAFRQQLEVGEDEVLVGFAGRTAAVKGVDRFAEIAQQAVATNSKLRFVAILPPGHAPNEADQAILDRAGVRQVPGAIIEELYPGLDVFLCTSRAEGFPNGVAEAMASEVYPICFDVGDCALLVGATGRIVPAGDISGMLDVLLNVTSSEALQHSKKQARQRVAEEFGVAAMVQATEQVLVEAADSVNSVGGC